MQWFDGHLDLTYIALHGRDLLQPPASCGGTLQPPTITFPTLRKAGVTAAFSTIFVRKRTADVKGSYTYNSPAEAYVAALRQIGMHRAWRFAGVIANFDPAERLSPDASEPTRIALAVEGAACLRSIDDAQSFHDAGVRMLSLAWAEGSPWSGGDQTGGDITPAGLGLIDRLDTLAITHDVSHLSEQAFWTLLTRAKGRIVASHSNCRALLPGAQHPERHLSDEQIRALAQHSAIIGINLFAKFILPAETLQTRRATIADLLRHIHHIEQTAGTRDLLALGSDMDSGYTPDQLPEDLQGPQDLPKLAEALSQANWSDSDIKKFAWRWADILH